MKLVNLLLYLLSFFIISCGNSSQDPKHVSSQENELKSGEQLARKYCISCHEFTDPSLLDKETWKFSLLPQMGYRLGMYGTTRRSSLIEKNQGGELVRQKNVFPENPLLTIEEWVLIQEYFYKEAPEELQIPSKSVKMGIDDLSVRIPAFHIQPPMITSITYNIDQEQVYVADVKGDYSTINVLDKTFTSISTLALPSPISHIEFKGDTILATLMGRFMPSDQPDGSIIKLFKVKESGNEYKGFVKTITDLQRPVYSLHTDVTGDGLADFIVCEFGNHTGKLSLFIADQKGNFNKKVLSKEPGASLVKVIDLNKDGHPDIMALMAQGNERIDVYLNDGYGNFTQQTLLSFSPVFGSVFFEVFDWNKDGLEDIIYVNGDNADFTRTYKPYHGLRIYLNQGGMNFKEVFFQQQNGAFKAIPYDFDLDGDTDIALSSFFPDLINSPEEGFLYLENISTHDSIHFNLKTFPQAAAGRWLSMEIMDVNRDKMPEIVLGSFVGLGINGDSTGQITQEFIDNSPTLTVLSFSRNREVRSSLVK